ncbi:MAG: MoaD/ThiS family protein [Mogibacterium sp.]|nr:MoaD/ThiS family protein [Mogibacterium sp.]
MVHVQLFGLFRLDSGIRELDVDVDSIRKLYPVLLAKAKEIDPNTTVTARDIDGCIIVINGVQSRKTAKLKDGDQVMLMSPVCGG